MAFVIILFFSVSIILNFSSLQILLINFKQSCVLGLLKFSNIPYFSNPCSFFSLTLLVVQITGQIHLTSLLCLSLDITISINSCTPDVSLAPFKPSISSIIIAVCLNLFLLSTQTETFAIPPIVSLICFLLRVSLALHSIIS